MLYYDINKTHYTRIFALIPMTYTNIVMLLIFHLTWKKKKRIFEHPNKT